MCGGGPNDTIRQLGWGKRCTGNLSHWRDTFLNRPKKKILYSPRRIFEDSAGGGGTTQTIWLDLFVRVCVRVLFCVRSSVYVCDCFYFCVRFAVCVCVCVFCVPVSESVSRAVCVCDFCQCLSLNVSLCLSADGWAGIVVGLGISVLTCTCLLVRQTFLC